MWLGCQQHLVHLGFVRSSCEGHLCAFKSTGLQGGVPVLPSPLIVWCEVWHWKIAARASQCWPFHWPEPWGRPLSLAKDHCPLLEWTVSWPGRHKVAELASSPSALGTGEGRTRYLKRCQSFRRWSRPVPEHNFCIP